MLFFIVDFSFLLVLLPLWCLVSCSLSLSSFLESSESELEVESLWVLLSDSESLVLYLYFKCYLLQLK